MELPAPGHHAFITTGSSSLCPFRNGSNEEKVIPRGRQRSERGGGGQGRLREGREKPGQCSLLEPAPMNLGRKLWSTEQKQKKNTQGSHLSMSPRGTCAPPLGQPSSGAQNE